MGILYITYALCALFFLKKSKYGFEYPIVFNKKPRWHLPRGFQSFILFGKIGPVVAPVIRFVLFQLYVPGYIKRHKFYNKLRGFVQAFKPRERFYFICIHFLLLFYAGSDIL